MLESNQLVKKKAYWVFGNRKAMHGPKKCQETLNKQYVPSNQNNVSILIRIL